MFVYFGLFWFVLETSTCLPKHPNIINVHTAFVDNTAIMPDSMEAYPYMLPRALNREGYGRTKTMFLVMPKYTSSLQNYLEENPLISFETRLNLFCQLLEGLAFLERNMISHRDLKSDNLLIDSTSEWLTLVIADFGSCFDGRPYNMKLPYQSEYVDKGGNPALLAPEVYSYIFDPNYL